MFSELKDRFLNWYNSLTERDKKILVIAMSILLPMLSIYIYKKQYDQRSKLEQKLISLPTVDQLKSQILVLEKKEILYKENIPKLNAMLLNPPLEYAYSTQLNQVPIILNSEISSYGAYITSFEESPPIKVTINKGGKETRTTTNLKKQAKRPEHNLNQETFEAELLPIKLVIATYKDKVLSFLNNFNTPNSVYPFVLIKTLSFGFGKNANCNGISLEGQSYDISAPGNMAIVSSPVNVCMSGYVLVSISKVQGSPARRGKHAKKR